MPEAVNAVDQMVVGHAIGREAPRRSGFFHRDGIRCRQHRPGLRHAQHAGNRRLVDLQIVDELRFDEPVEIAVADRRRRLTRHQQLGRDQYDEADHDHQPGVVDGAFIAWGRRIKAENRAGQATVS